MADSIATFYLPSPKRSFLLKRTLCFPRFLPAAHNPSELGVPSLPRPRLKSNGPSSAITGSQCRGESETKSREVGKEGQRQMQFDAEAVAEAEAGGGGAAFMKTQAPQRAACPSLLVECPPDPYRPLPLPSIRSRFHAVLRFPWLPSTRLYVCVCTLPTTNPWPKLLRLSRTPAQNLFSVSLYTGEYQEILLGWWSAVVGSQKKKTGSRYSVSQGKILKI